MVRHVGEQLVELATTQSVDAWWYSQFLLVGKTQNPKCVHEQCSIENSGKHRLKQTITQVRHALGVRTSEHVSHDCMHSQALGPLHFDRGELDCPALGRGLGAPPQVGMLAHHDINYGCRTVHWHVSSHEPFEQDGKGCTAEVSTGAEGGYVETRLTP